MTEPQETKAAPTKSVNKPLPKSAAAPPGDIRRRKAGPRRKGPFVKYVGQASHRKITPTQWKSLNIPLKDARAEHLWSVANDKMIESAEFTDEQLDYLLIDDKQSGKNAHSFLEVDYDEQGQLVQVVAE